MQGEQQTTASQGLIGPVRMGSGRYLGDDDVSGDLQQAPQADDGLRLRGREAVGRRAWIGHSGG